MHEEHWYPVLSLLNLYTVLTWFCRLMKYNMENVLGLPFLNGSQASFTRYQTRFLSNIYLIWWLSFISIYNFVAAVFHSCKILDVLERQFRKQHSYCQTWRKYITNADQIGFYMNTIHWLFILDFNLQIIFMFDISWGLWWYNNEPFNGCTNIC